MTYAAIFYLRTIAEKYSRNHSSRFSIKHSGTCLPLLSPPTRDLSKRCAHLAWTVSSQTHLLLSDPNSRQVARLSVLAQIPSNRRRIKLQELAGIKKCDLVYVQAFQPHAIHQPRVKPAHLINSHPLEKA